MNHHQSKYTHSVTISLAEVRTGDTSSVTDFIRSAYSTAPAVISNFNTLRLEVDDCLAEPWADALHSKYARKALLDCPLLIVLAETGATTHWLFRSHACGISCVAGQRRINIDTARLFLSSLTRRLVPSFASRELSRSDIFAANAVVISKWQRMIRLLSQ